MESIFLTVHNTTQYSKKLNSDSLGHKSHISFDLYLVEYKMYVKTVVQVYPAWLNVCCKKTTYSLWAFANELVHDIGYMIYRVEQLLESAVMCAYLPVSDLRDLLGALKEIYDSLLDSLTPDAIPDFYCALLKID